VAYCGGEIANDGVKHSPKEDVQNRHRVLNNHRFNNPLAKWANSGMIEAICPSLWEVTMAGYRVPEFTAE